jgi:hypothetical protein
MRLLDSSTLALKEFVGSRIPEYAILSHRWLDEEVTLRDVQDGKASTKQGYDKIKKCCEQAAKDGLKYAWVDTCCIDKSSSAELNEAINSMYKWYQGAKVCYAYLSDVSSSHLSSDDTSFRRSAWFSRGWTLQELTAPACVEFYNESWQKIGTKDHLKVTIFEITNIDVAMLAGGDPDDFSVAKRMSWASKRTTTRPEDRAYSLLGLFGVNMPMLYGEGDRAFIRLQEEIMKHSDDQSMFAWKRHGIFNWRSGLLAKSPSEFEDCSNIVRARVPWNKNPYSVSNKGLSIELPMVSWAMETYLVALDCEIENVPDSRIGIYLQLLDEEGQYCRVPIDGSDSQIFHPQYFDKMAYRRLYVRQKDRLVPPAQRMYGFWIRSLPEPITTVYGKTGGRDLSSVNSLMPWSDSERVLEMPTGTSGTAGTIRYVYSQSRSTVLKLGFDADFNPICQWGGRIGSPGAKFSGSASREAEMHPSWMEVDVEDNQYLHKGRRLGRYVSHSISKRITMTNEVVNGVRVWVLDIVYTHDKPRHSGVLCNDCGTVSVAILPCLHSRSNCSTRLSRVFDTSAQFALTLTFVKCVSRLLRTSIRHMHSRPLSRHCHGQISAADHLGTLQIVDFRKQACSYLYRRPT